MLCWRHLVWWRCWACVLLVAGIVGLPALCQAEYEDSPLPRFTDRPVAQAGYGMEARKLARQLRPDLVIMDAALPDINGKEATHRIKEAEAGAGTKVLADAAHSLEEERADILAAGCDDYIPKPYRESGRHGGGGSATVARGPAAAPDTWLRLNLPSPAVGGSSGDVQDSHGKG